MKLDTNSPERIEFSNDAGNFTRYVRLFLIAVVLVTIISALFGGKLSSVVIALVAGGFFWKLADHVNVASRAVFDRTENRFHLIHTRAGKTIAERTEPLDAIENVIIESSHRSKAEDNSLKARPALVIGGETGPLTFAAFVNGPEPAEIANSLRRFLKLPETDLIDDSIRQAVTAPAGTGPAVRLARFGKGMGRLEAARHVTELQKQMSESDRPTHVISREQS